MIECKVIRAHGEQADELMKVLNKMFGGKVEEEPTEGDTPEAEQPVSCETKIAMMNKDLFDAHVAVGFTEEQALEIVKAIIMA